jgi:ADP-heptose:LPS heptosyltransferase
MSDFRQILKQTVYLPTLPCNFKSLVGLLRFVGLLPAKRKSSGENCRILIAQPYDSLGDLVLSFPLLDEVHRQWPEAEIDLIVGRAMTSLFRGVPYIHRVLGFTPTPSRPLSRHRDVLRLLSFCRREMRDGYDLALDPRWDSDGYAYLARAMVFLSGASVRVGYSGCVDGVDLTLDEFLTHLAQGGRNEHESIRKLRLLQRTGLCTRVVEESAVLQVNATLCAVAELGKTSLGSLLHKAGIQPGERYVALAPSATTPMRVWPIEYLAKLIQTLHARYGLRFVVVGTSSDVVLCNGVVAMCPEIAVSLAGKTNIGELLALLANAALFIGNDSGPAHLSGILGRDTVTISPFPVSSNRLDHFNAPRRFRPCGPRVRVIQPNQPLPPCDPVCSWDEAHCITQVSAEAVLGAYENLLLTNSSKRCQLETAQIL